MSVKNRIKKFLDSIEMNISTFEKSINVSNGYVNSISKSIGIDKLGSIIENHSILNIEWLLTGKGDMLKSNSSTQIDQPIKKGIPLLPITAAAGFGDGGWQIQEQDIQERYVVPEFNNIDFMIRVKGSSMYPKYNSGDVIACRKMTDSQFIQWNKVYVLSTKEQGILVKRLKKSDSNKNLIAISDNEKYDPFEIPKSEIDGMALVIGVIRLE